MTTDVLLAQHIQTIDHFFYHDLWHLISQHGQPLEEVEIQQEENVVSE